MPYSEAAWERAMTVQEVMLTTKLKTLPRRLPAPKMIRLKQLGERARCERGPSGGGGPLGWDRCGPVPIHAPTPGCGDVCLLTNDRNREIMLRRELSGLDRFQS